MKLIYLAHPYGGKPENICKAVDLGTDLQTEYEDYHIFNAAYYFCKYHGVFNEERIMQMCLDMVKRCDELWLAPGWKGSPGCNAELVEANRYGMPVRYLTGVRGDE